MLINCVAYQFGRRLTDELDIESELEDAEVDKGMARTNIGRLYHIKRRKVALEQRRSMEPERGFSNPGAVNGR